MTLAELLCPQCEEEVMHPETLRFWRVEHEGEERSVCPRCYLKIRKLYGEVRTGNNGWKGRAA